ncbi:MULTISPECIES: putative transporter small subunit [Pseudoalteromonas]|jgi:hypothetical protein|uniref:Uncharacterized protein n=3 Tax=Pseudoalteromonas TaxID=53246 RepID=Q3ICA1_PSET1|nr:MULTISPECIES: putative transporter small subunit [Pseudoalteromonas]ALS35084.1 hypothetical protein PTRA_b0638 [Pseudoalteromonas translucida KMM 520]ASM56159.1 hypothetical protein PNIG_b0601 [Pseudoalteromonas nigrifaciens]WMS96458.1 putative transporter small subunit [Pseudoalteromonas sp. HL-AS2]CAI89479.1 conserved protein of unknown function; putative membrane protein [Pseudoalteromonas translucida]SJN46191.1 conserved protein of unknown function; putative membrane protein [Pseudoalte|tara:strand:- start:52042 stop:52173 length:132 start_codon:yes stop_codon:yes gene_type:complete
MSTTLLTIYVLIWPVIAFGVFVILLCSLIKDLKNAKQKGKNLV